MNRFKQSAYTVLLAATCFVASPLIFHQIWKSSSDAKKQTQSPPLVVKTEGRLSADSSVIDKVQEHTMGPVDIITTEADDNPKPMIVTTAADTTNSEAKKQPELFVTSDPSYFDDALFIGDSRTVGIKEYGTFKNSVFFCEPGFSACRIDEAKVGGKSLDDILTDGKFGKIYIMLGINEVGNDFEYTLGAYRSLVEKVMEKQPEALVFLQANLHVSASAEDKVINNSGINSLNNAIATLADDKRVFYIDINELYDDDHGALNEGYTSDGVHPVAMYYTQWCEWLCTKTVPVPESETTAPATAASTEASSEAATEASTEKAEPASTD